jgi:type IV pilus assembly protein PilM
MAGLLHRFKRPAGNHLGIDIGSYAIKVVELDVTAAGPVPLHHAITPLPPGSREVGDLAACLVGLLREHGITTREAVAAVSGPEVAVRRLRLPNLPTEEIQGAVRWQAGKSFPFPLEDALLALHVLPGRGVGEETGVEVLAAAATRKVVMESVAVLQKAGLRCLGVLAESHVWAQLLEGGGLPADSDAAQAVVDLGASKTGIHIFQSGVLQFSRYISTSGDALTEALSGVMVAGEHKVTMHTAQAEALKHEYGIPTEGDPETTAEGIPVSSIGVRMRPVLEKLETEISRSLDYYAYQYGGGPITRMLLAGGGSQLKGMESFFSEWFDMQVDTLEPLAGLGGEGGTPVSSLPAASRSVLAVAAGLALPMRGQFNLVPLEMLQERKRRISGPAAYAALGLLFLLPLVQYVWQGERRVDAVRQAADAQMRQVARYQEVLSDYEHLQQRKSQLDRQLAALPRVRLETVPVAAALKSISQRFPEEAVLTSVEFEPQENGSARLWLRGVIYGPETAGFAVLSRFLEHLERAPVFDGIELGMAGASESGPQSSLHFEIACMFHETEG